MTMATIRRLRLGNRPSRRAAIALATGSFTSARPNLAQAGRSRLRLAIHKRAPAPRNRVHEFDRGRGLTGGTDT